VWCAPMHISCNQNSSILLVNSILWVDFCAKGVSAIAPSLDLMERSSMDGGEFIHGGNMSLRKSQTQNVNVLKIRCSGYDER
jgi:hypothetical protein